MTIPHNPKNQKRNPISTVPTPIHLANHIAETISHILPYTKTILDPGVGAGNLIAPYENHYRIGFDINPHNPPVDEYYNEDFLTNNRQIKPDIIIMNPPFNGMRPHHAPEEFLRKAQTYKCPIVAIIPAYTRMNNETINSKRYEFLRTLNITSIMTVPRGIFENHTVHTEVIYIDVPNMPPHHML